jgi:hypothetical protein
MSISEDDMIHLLDNSTPYPVDLDAAVLRYMVTRMMEMTEIHKRPHPVWKRSEEGSIDSPPPMDPD